MQGIYNNRLGKSLQFIGLINFNRRFIPDVAKIEDLLNNQLAGVKKTHTYQMDERTRTRIR